MSSERSSYWLLNKHSYIKSFNLHSDLQSGLLCSVPPKKVCILSIWALRLFLWEYFSRIQCWTLILVWLMIWKDIFVVHRNFASSILELLIWLVYVISGGEDASSIFYIHECNSYMCGYFRWKNNEVYTDCFNSMSNLSATVNKNFVHNVHNHMHTHITFRSI
jgi:hypothetical protein